MGLAAADPAWSIATITAVRSVIFIALTAVDGDEKNTILRKS
jgi:hypothetical protein